MCLFRIKAKTIPIFLLVLILLSFGLWVSRLGYYWDDWPSIWFLHFFNYSIFKESFAVDRPLLAWIFMLTTRIAGESTLMWQILGLLARWLTSLALWWSLGLLWPRNTLQRTWVVLLFTVYPGFRQQYISVTYSNAFLVFAIYMTSFGLMILALRQTRWYWPLFLTSIALAAASLFITEYFFGLELLRLVILWIVTSERSESVKKRLRSVFLSWLPYAGVMVAFLVWRVLLFNSPRGEVIIFDQLRQSLTTTLLNLVKTIFQDFFEVSFLAWVNTVKIANLLDFSPIIVFIYVAVVILAMFLTIFLLIRLQPEENQEEANPQTGKSWAWQALIMGVFSLLVAGWPFWVTELHIELIFPWDRFTLAMMLGVAFLFSGLVGLISRSRVQSAILVGVLVGLAAGMHYHDGWFFRREWLAQKDFFWQLSWRAPAIQPGTTILISDLPFTYYSDNSLTAPLNWTYAPNLNSQTMPYLLFDVESRLGKQLPSLEPDIPIQLTYRATKFTGSTSQAFLIFYEPPRCLKVMHPVEDRNLPYKPRFIPDALPLSNPNLILNQAPNPAMPPLPILAPEPPHGWCYYYEKAELAAQTRNWEEVVKLGEEALKLGKEFTRETASELIPFIKGYAHLGNWEEAVKLSITAYKASPKMQNMLCSTWYYLQQDIPSNTARDSAVGQIRDQIQCNFP